MIQRKTQSSLSGVGTLLSASLLTAAIGLGGCTQEPGEVVYRSSTPAPVDDNNELGLYVAQCEAVLGPIPEISCDPENPAPGTHVSRIPVFSDGMLLGFGGDWDGAEFERRAEEEDYSCDFPSLGGDFACSVGSTLVQYSNDDNPNVQWVGLCRGVGEDTPDYDRFIGNGLIGANTVTGEMCFFFGANEDTDEDYVLPKLTSDVDSNEDLKPWLPPAEMPGSCLSCHPNNDPWVMTPWLQPSYMAQLLTSDDYPLTLPEGVELTDVMAAQHIRQTPYKTMLPEALPSGRTAWTEEEIFGEDGVLLKRQYRAVGSSYVAAEAAGTVAPRKGAADPRWSINFRERLQLQPAESSCASGCHATANSYFETLAYDSLGDKYATKYLSDGMSDRALQDTWMPLGGGPVEHWEEMFESAEATIPAITECPIPKQLDTPVAISVTCGDGAPEAELRWTYVNDYGGVPGRDDVRFDVALSFGTGSGKLGIAGSGSPEGVRMDAPSENVMILRDVAPEPGTDEYRVVVPFSEDAPLLHVDVQPKRFCFEEPDRRPFAYARPEAVRVESSCE
ncbi:MAG: hypothetical protein ACRBN8_31945 [Nannocystales bacterium]